MALLSLADLYESLKKPDLAIKVYDRIPPSSPLHRNAEIQIAPISTRSIAPTKPKNGSKV